MGLSLNVGGFAGAARLEALVLAPLAVAFVADVLCKLLALSPTFAVTTGAFTSDFSVEWLPVVQPGILRNSSKERTGLLVSLQQVYDFKPSWKRGAPG